MDTTVTHIVDRIQKQVKGRGKADSARKIEPQQETRGQQRGHDDEELAEDRGPSQDAGRKRRQQPSPSDIDPKQLDMLVESAQRGPQAIAERLHALDTEWDAERLLQLNVSTLALCGMALSAATGKRRWLLVPAVVLPLSIADALAGQKRLAPLWHRLGLRTRADVDRERLALRMLRGDFDLKDAPHDARSRAVFALRAAAR